MITTYKPCRLADSGGDLSKIWYVEYYIFSETQNKLRRKRYVLAQPTTKLRLAAAKIAIKKINDWLASGAVVDQKPIPKNTQISSKSTISEAIDTFKDIKQKTTKPRTYQSYCSDIRNFEKFLEENNLKEITLEKFDEIIANRYMDELSTNGASNRRRNNLKGTLGTIFNFFIDRKIILINPFSKIKKLNTVARKHSAYSKTDIKRIKNECIASNQSQLWLFIAFIYYAAIRPGEELRRLKIGDIKEKTIFIDGGNAKNSRSEHIMIPEPLEKLIAENNLRAYPQDYYVFSRDEKVGEQLLGKHYFYDRHVVILKKIGLHGKNYDLYSWKHTGVIALFQATQNIELIRQHCRHSDLDTTQKYLRDLGLFIDYEQINKFPEL